MGPSATHTGSTRRVPLCGIAVGLAMLLPGIYCQLQGQIYRSGESYYYGWPLAHPGDGYRLLSNSFFLDLLAIIVVAAATGCVADLVVRKLRSGARFSLRWMLIHTAIAACMLQLIRAQNVKGIYCWPADFIDRSAFFDPLAIRYPVFIALPTLLGDTAVFYAVVLAAQLAPSLLKPAARPAATSASVRTTWQG